MDEPDEVTAAEPGDGVESARHSDTAAAPGRHLAEDTGHPAVDAVLASLEGLEAMPVHEHVAVFETAHESLRRALDEAGDEAGDETGDETAAGPAQPATGPVPSGEQGQG